MAQYRPKNSYMPPSRTPKLKADLMRYMIEGMKSLSIQCFHSFIPLIGFRRDLKFIFPKSGMSAHQAEMAQEFGEALTKLHDGYFVGADAQREDQSAGAADKWQGTTEAKIFNVFVRESQPEASKGELIPYCSTNK